MRHAIRLATAATLCGVIVSGCGRSRGGTATTPFPPRFTPVDWGAAPSPEAAGGPQEGCATRIRDDRDGTMLLLRRSESRRESTRDGDAIVTHYYATGDYEVLTPGRYGVAADQWLRVNCGSWRAVGPVPRTD